jgi:esterase/lipase superfamily enzyme
MRKVKRCTMKQLNTNMVWVLPLRSASLSGCGTGELRMGKRVVLLSGATLFALTLTLGGCGKKEEPAPPPPPPAPAPAAPAPSEPAAPGGEMKAPAEQPATGAAPEKKEETSSSPKSETGSRVYPVWYGTNRAPVDPKDQKKGYTSKRDSINHYGKCLVVIPQSHQFGSVGSAWYRRWLKGDDRLWMKEVIPLAEDSFLKDVRDTLAKQTRSDRSLLVYIHGYNVTFQEAAIRAAQIGVDLKVPGITAFYSWPSMGSLDGYAADYDAVQFSEEDISRFLVMMAKDSNADTVHILAHSMGNQALLRGLYRATAQAAITTGLKFAQIFLAAPDVDVDLFKQLANVYPTVAQRTTMYVSAKDRALGVSSWLRKDLPRAGYTPPVTTIRGIDTVEATNIDVTILGHSYFAEAAGILYDMHDLLLHNTPPERRPRLMQRTTSAGVPYWSVD